MVGLDVDVEQDDVPEPRLPQLLYRSGPLAADVAADVDAALRP